MTFKISIKEVCEAVVYVEANSYTQALKRLKMNTGRARTIMYLNQKTQHLNKTKSPSFRGALII